MLKLDVPDKKGTSGMCSSTGSVSICLICDSSYVMYTSVAITSILENKEADVHYDINVISCDLSQEDIETLNGMTRLDASIHVVKAENTEKYKSLEKEGFPVSTAALFKFDLPGIFPDLDRILYLDGDLIVQHGLKALFDSDLEGAYAGVVSDYRGMSLKGDFRKRLNTTHTNYFNSGVMLLDLARMRDDDISRKLLDYRIHGVNYYMDQDAFNMVLGERVKYLSFYDNFQMTCWRSMSIEQISTHYHLPLVNDRYEYIAYANILHYSAEKPWKYYDGKCSEIWMHYFMRSPFAHVNLGRSSILSVCKNDADKARLYQNRVNNPKQYRRTGDPLVSVIMPAYNAEAFIGKALGSLQKQTLMDFEVICVNDASTDKTEEVIQTYAKYDPRIRFITQTENHGAGAARNLAIRQARGEYITFLDADDLLPVQALERFYQVGKQTDADFVFAQLKDDKGKILSSSYKMDYIPQRAVFSAEDVSEHAFSMTHGGPSGKMVRRKFVLDNHLHFLEIARSEDFFFFCMILATAKRMTAIPEALYTVVQEANPNSLEHTKDETPALFWDGVLALKDELSQKGLYEQFKRTFINSNIVRTGYNLRALRTTNGLIEAQRLMKEQCNDVLELNQHNEEYFYEQDAFHNLLDVIHMPVEQLITQQINRMAAQQVDRTRHSTSWKIVRTITWIPRKIKGFIRVTRQKGPAAAWMKTKKTIKALPANAQKLWIEK